MMTWDAVWQVSTAVIASIGTAGGLLLALSGYLGKMWADRLMGRERAAHEQELAELRNRLEHQTNTQLAEWEAKLSIYRDKHLRGFNDKLATYRLIVDLVSEILGDFDHWQTTRQPLLPERFDALNRARMKAYGYLAMLAPQAVMDALDALFDHLLQIANGKAPYHWATVRGHALVLLNEARKDVGIDHSPIEYKGAL